jgi:hypothetical protein
MAAIAMAAIAVAGNMRRRGKRRRGRDMGYAAGLKQRTEAAD